jgi:hypothetical protein
MFIEVEQVYFPIPKIIDGKADFGINKKSYLKVSNNRFHNFLESLLT